jgi:hypothetical protein
MSQLWVEIEQLVFDGVPLDQRRGRRIAALTETALERLLRERGTTAAVRSARGTREFGRRDEKALPPTADEARLADQLAKALCRAIDGNV